MPSSSRRRAKIVCTLGPASNTPQMIAALIEEGMDVARLNFSHGSHDFHRGVIEAIRDASRKANKHVAIMQDLQGPKLRAGRLQPGGLMLKAGDVLLLFPEGSTPKISTHGKIPVPISAEIAMSISKDAQKGARILFDDGKIATRALDVQAPELVVEVEVGGKLTDHKGMNLPDTPLTMSCLTEKDLEDLKFGLEMGVDGVALSFVRRAQDIVDLKDRIRKQSSHVPFVVAKIERDEAIECQDSIIEVTDGIMIARGDMAVEIGPERVPAVQKRMIKACNELGVPVITATQMLESMTGSPTPTRAEASDVANAVFDGTDALMLSAESASGEYPREAVRTMARVIVEAERWREDFSRHTTALPMPGSVVEAIEASAANIANQVGAVAIAALSHSGVAVRVLARYRPDAPIVAIMDNEAMLRRLAFVWGVRGVQIPKIVSTDDLFSMVETVMLTNNWAQVEDIIVVTAGVPTLRRGTTNMVKVHRIGAQSDRKIRP